MYDRKVTITRIAKGDDCVPGELTSASGKKHKKRHRTLDVILVNVGGMGDAENKKINNGVGIINVMWEINNT
jgi:hypothetical protein